MSPWFPQTAPSAGVLALAGGLLGGALAVLLTVDSGPKAWLEAALLALVAAAVGLLGPRGTPGSWG